MGLLTPPHLLRARQGSMVQARYGIALENLVETQLQGNSHAAGLFLRLGGAHRPDWIPRTAAGLNYNFFTNRNFDLFTLNAKQTRSHLGRLYGGTMEPIYYLRPPGYIFQ
jgi:hypothetical protein